MDISIDTIKKQLEQTRNDYWNVDPAAGQLMQALLFTHQPTSILEIGTSNGYSAIVMAEIASQYGGHITSIEFHEKRIILAKENLKITGLSDTVTILQGDALEVLRSFREEQFGFFFIDANKKQYGDYFTECVRLAQPGAIILADNTVSHRDQLDTFFEAVKKESRASLLELPIGTGLAICAIR